MNVSGLFMIMDRAIVPSHMQKKEDARVKNWLFLLFAAFVCSSSWLMAQEYRSDANTVLLLHMNETSGSTVSDASTFANHGTATGTTIVDGRFGKARKFSNEGQYVGIDRRPLKNTNFTSEAWINASNLTKLSMIFLSNLHSGADKGYFLDLRSTGKLHFAVGDGLGGDNHLFGNSSLTVNSWYHVAATYDGSKMRIYLNGVIDAEASWNKLAYETDNAFPFKVGEHNFNAGETGSFDGIIDEVRISNIARSPNEFSLQLPPRNLTASASGTSINLNWQNGGGAVGLLRYRVYRGTDSTNVALVDSTTSTSFQNSGLSAGTRYFYRVRAVDSTGFEGAKSYAANVTTPSSASLTYYVNATRGNNTTGDGSLGNPWKTITYALSQITGTGVVQVAAGVHDTTLGETFPILMKNGLSLEGAGQDATILDAQRTNSVIRAVGISDTTTVVQGMTIRGGGNTNSGGGIFITAGSALKIFNNKITGNEVASSVSAARVGGGILVSNSSPTIFGNEIMDNVVLGVRAPSDPSDFGAYGGGIGISGATSSPIIRGNTISRNEVQNSTFAVAFGAGIGIVNSANPLVYGNLITKNILHRLYATSGNTYGAGIYIDRAGGTIARNVIAENTLGADYGSLTTSSAVYVTGSPSVPRILSNTIAKNSDNGITSNASAEPRIINNTIVENTGEGILLISSSPDSIINNILALNGKYGINESTTSADPKKAWYNLFHANSSGLYRDEAVTDYFTAVSLNSNVAEAKNNFEGDPLFVDRTSGDYRLRPGSPAIDAGDPASPNDPDGSRVDVGAHYYDKFAPLATTNTATSVTAISATLNGVVNPKGTSTTAYFEWASSSSLTNGTSTPVQSIGSGTSNVPITAPIVGLNPKTTYYYRIVAQSSGGVEKGSIVSFTTLLLRKSLHVAPSGNDVNAGTAIAPVRTIQKALTLAGSGDTIKVAAGSYDESLIPLTSVYLRGGYESGFLEGARDFFANKTIVRGVGSVMLNDTARSTVEGFIFHGQGVPTDAILKVRSGSIIRNNVILRASQSFVAGVEILGSATVMNNTIFKCSYGIEISGSINGTPLIKNNIIAYGSWGIVHNASSVLSSARPYNDVFGNSFNYTGFLSEAALGDRSLNPLFRDTSAAALDFRLGSGSPCIDAGDPADPAGNEPAPNNDRIDMGAYGGSSQAGGPSVSGPTATTVSATALTSSSATLNGTVNPNGTNALAWFEYGTSNTLATSLSTQKKTVLSATSNISFSDGVTGLLPGTTYYFRVAAQNSTDSSRGSIISFTTTPTAPTLVAPANGATNQSTTVTLSWIAPTGATSYRLQVATGSSFASLVFDDSTITSTSRQVSSLANNTLYYWRVRAKNASGSGSFSFPYSFTTTGGLGPSVSTASATSITSSSATLNGTVNPGGSSTTAYFEWGTSSSLSSVSSTTAQSIGSGTSAVSVSANLSSLTPSMTYYYRIVGINTAGTQRGSIVSLTTAGGTLSSPTLSGPANGAANQPTTLTLGWSVSTGATAYRLQVSTAQGFASTVFDDSTITTASRQVGPLANNTTYYWRVQARNAGGLSSFAPAFSFTTIATAIISMPSPLSFPANPTSSTDYRLVSIPGVISSLTVGDLFNGTQKIDWRVYRDNGASVNFLTELSSSSSLNAGEGYWLLKKGSLSVSRSITMPSVSSDGTYSISLHSGWNIIGNPFDKSVPWALVRSANGLSSSLQPLTYNGTYVSGTTLEPFAGYYFDNRTAGLTQLKIPFPFPSTKVNGEEPPPVDWMLQLVFQSDINVDRENYIGVAPSASLNRDEMDNRKPPLFLDQGFLYFDRPQWDEEYRRFAADFRPSVGDGQVWDFEISNPRLSQAKITVRGLEKIPSEYDVTLLNLSNSVPIDVRTTSEYSYQTGSERMHFKLIVGKRSYVQGEVEKLVPESFALEQNYPNPFNPTTSITFTLPREAGVQVEVFSPVGQLIRTITDRAYPAGIHTILWDAMNEQGERVASGMYFYRLVADGVVIKTRKMIVLK